MSKNTTIPPHSVEVKIKGKKTVFRFYRFRSRRFFGFNFKQNRPSLIKTLSRLSLHYSFDTSIERHFVSFLTCITRFYIYLVKYFNLNEKFILLKDSSGRIGILYQSSDRMGFGLDNLGSDFKH